jgi:hypothetical protein
VVWLQRLLFNEQRADAKHSVQATQGTSQQRPHASAAGSDARVADETRSRRPLAKEFLLYEW